MGDTPRSACVLSFIFLSRPHPWAGKWCWKSSCVRPLSALEEPNVVPVNTSTGCAFRCKLLPFWWMKVLTALASKACVCVFDSTELAAFVASPLWWFNPMMGSKPVLIDFACKNFAPVPVTVLNSVLKESTEPDGIDWLLIIPNSSWLDLRPYPIFCSPGFHGSFDNLRDPAPCIASAVSFDHTIPIGTLRSTPSYPFGQFQSAPWSAVFGNFCTESWIPPSNLAELAMPCCAVLFAAVWAGSPASIFKASLAPLIPHARTGSLLLTSIAIIGCDSTLTTVVGALV